MIEIRFHGRGGQGAKTAAVVLADAAMDAGKYVQAFPEYGPERGGAPIKAFTRIDDRLIRLHSSVQNPDVVGVIDPTLLKSEDVTVGMKDDSVLVVNTDKSPAEIRSHLAFKKGRIITVDATKISFDCLGKNLPNMPILGAIVKATSMVTISDLEKNVEKKFLKKIGADLTKKNIEAIHRAFSEAKSE
jgi:pyruvate ferredoxin oxidoreductase gamma subunit